VRERELSRFYLSLSRARPAGVGGGGTGGRGDGEGAKKAKCVSVVYAQLWTDFLDGSATRRVLFCCDPEKRRRLSSCRLATMMQRVALRRYRESYSGRTRASLPPPRSPLPAPRSPYPPPGGGIIKIFAYFYIAVSAIVSSPSACYPIFIASYANDTEAIRETRRAIFVYRRRRRVTTLRQQRRSFTGSKQRGSAARDRNAEMRGKHSRAHVRRGKGRRALISAACLTRVDWRLSMEDYWYRLSGIFRHNY
jgi:hypothetical protein